MLRNKILTKFSNNEEEIHKYKGHSKTKEVRVRGSMVSLLGEVTKGKFTKFL